MEPVGKGPNNYAPQNGAREERDGPGLYHDTHGNNASTLPAATFAHNTTPNLRILGNPGPLGLFAFATTTFISSMYIVHSRGVTVQNAIIGMSLFVGGLALLLAGMWEFAYGNTFGATFFTLYGGFWLAYSAILIPAFGIVSAYSSQPDKLSDALGIFFAGWFIVTFLFLISSLRISIGMILLFFFWDLAYLLWMASNFTDRTGVSKAGGAMGIVTAFVAWYCGTAQLLSRENSFFTLPIGNFNRNRSRAPATAV
jgi:succinate-acetate transporter protein